MPLWKPYLGMLDSRIADIGNAGSSRLAGAITAALFLERFVPEALPWMHVDVYAWNDSDRPGRPAAGFMPRHPGRIGLRCTSPSHFSCSSSRPSRSI